MVARLGTETVERKPLTHNWNSGSYCITRRFYLNGFCLTGIHLIPEFSTSDMTMGFSEVFHDKVRKFLPTAIFGTGVPITFNAVVAMIYHISACFLPPVLSSQEFVTSSTGVWLSSA